MTGSGAQCCVNSWVGLDDFKGLFQPSRFYDSIIL